MQPANSQSPRRQNKSPRSILPISLADPAIFSGYQAGCEACSSGIDIPETELKYVDFRSENLKISFSSHLTYTWSEYGTFPKLRPGSAIVNVSVFGARAVHPGPVRYCCLLELVPTARYTAGTAGARLRQVVVLSDTTVASSKALVVNRTFLIRVNEMKK